MLRMLVRLCRVPLAVAAALLLSATAAPAKPLAGSSGPSFALVDQNGQRITEAELARKPTVIHFGFTRCPAICPTTLYEVAQRMRELAGTAGEINFAFVTVDPEHDTPELLKEYVASFDDRIIALSGRSSEIARLAAGLGATYAKVPLDGDNYTMDHSVGAFLVARGWKIGKQLYMGVDSSREQVLRALRELARPDASGRSGAPAATAAH